MLFAKMVPAGDVEDLSEKKLSSIEICAGGGGQAIGLELADFEHLALVENDKHACNTLRENRKHWNVVEKDVRKFLEEDAASYVGKVDLLAGGVPCPPFSIAGKQLGHEDERDLFPVALSLVELLKPRAVMLENVRGLLQPRFDDYRERIDSRFRELKYGTRWKLLNASDFGVPQLRPRVVCVALPLDLIDQFKWEDVAPIEPVAEEPTVGAALKDLMSERGWKHVDKWVKKANKIAPTLVGGSKKHGGADLGPTRAKRAWLEMGVDAMGLADAPPEKNQPIPPKLTVTMTAVLQGFPRDWKFTGGKTAAYRQVGNAFPPPVAAAVANRIATILQNDDGAREERDEQPSARRAQLHAPTS